ncbi:MAG: hypothetical protein P8Y07_06275 [Gemmatimonadales bacterium]
MNTKLARRVAVLAALAILPTPTSLLGQEREAPADGGEHAADLSSPVTCEKCHTDFSFLSGKTDSAYAVNVWGSRTSRSVMSPASP